MKKWHFLFSLLTLASLVLAACGGSGAPVGASTKMQQHGEMPLPPYITAPLGDPDRYQTVYASQPGSAAAPTAGLHLTPSLLSGLEAAGIPMARVELVVGLDTFRPVSEADPRQHHIHTERYVVSPETLERCRSARRRRVTSVALAMMICCGSPRRSSRTTARV